MKSEFQIKLLPISIFDLLISKSFRKDFKSIVKEWLKNFLNEFSFVDLPIEQANVILNIDWKDWADELFKCIDTSIPLSEITEDYQNYLLLPDIDYISFDEFINKNCMCETNKEIVILKGQIEHNLEGIYTSDLLRVMIFHIWRCANISFPGVLNLYQADLIVGAEECAKLDLCVDCLNNIYINEYTYKFKQVHIIDISKTCECYKTIIDTKKYYTNNKFDRALTGLFNFIRLESFIQANIVNLFLGIESFYTLGGSEILNKLKSRSIMYLDIIQNKKDFKNAITKFYNYRSRFVHGDNELLIYADLLENGFISEDNKYYNEFWETCEFGVYLLLLSIQKAILENRINLNFDEVIKDEMYTVDDAT